MCSRALARGQSDTSRARTTCEPSSFISGDISLHFPSGSRANSNSTYKVPTVLWDHLHFKQHII